MRAAVAEAEDICRPIKKDCRRRKRESAPIGGENVPRADVAEGWNFRGSRRCGCEDEQTTRFQKASDRRSGIQPTADSAEERMEPEPIRRKEEWWKGRFGGRENGVGADSAGVLMLPRADTAEGRIVLGADFN